MYEMTVKLTVKLGIDEIPDEVFAIAGSMPQATSHVVWDDRYNDLCYALESEECEHWRMPDKNPDDIDLLG